MRSPSAFRVTERYGPRLIARLPSLDTATTRGRQRICGPPGSKNIAHASPTSALPREIRLLTKRASGSTKLRKSALSRTSAARLKAVSAHITSCTTLASVADTAAITNRKSAIKVWSSFESNRQNANRSGRMLHDNAIQSQIVQATQLHNCVFGQIEEGLIILILTNLTMNRVTQYGTRTGKR